MTDDDIPLPKKGFAKWSGDVGDPDAPSYPITSEFAAGHFVDAESYIHIGILLAESCAKHGVVYAPNPVTLLRHAREIMDLCIGHIDAGIRRAADAGDPAAAAAMERAKRDALGLAGSSVDDPEAEILRAARRHR